MRVQAHAGAHGSDRFINYTAHIPNYPDQLNVHLRRWLLYFVIAIGLGYASVFRYSPPSTGALSDTGYYFATTERGVGAVVDGPGRADILAAAAGTDRQANWGEQR